MLTHPPPDALDLLVVGGLTIDRFADGSSVPGGSVTHIARAAASRGLRVGVVAVAGPEPVAQAGLAELRRLAAVVQVAVGTETATFRHSGTRTERRLYLDRRGADVDIDAADLGRLLSRALLFAPVAGEVRAHTLDLGDAERQRAAILQGWLRTTDPDSQVRSLALAALDPAVLRALGRLDLLVASRDDMLAEGDDASNQLHALRRAVGNGPSLVLTDGANGLWLNVGESQRYVAAPWRVDGVSTVGAGDVLAAFMLVALAAERRPAEAAQQAMRLVAEVLEERKRG
jgi:sugar/nucleoside kinase (ribokinase family)